MTLPTSSARDTTFWRNLGLVLLIAFTVVALMVLATAFMGVQATGPLYDIVPDPAGLSGLSF